MGAYISPSRQERASRALAALRHGRKTLHRFGWCSSRDVALSDGIRFTIVGALSTGPDQLGAWFARMLLHRVLPMGCTLDAFEASRHTEQADVERLLRKAEAEAAQEARITILDDVRARGAAPTSTPSHRRVGT